MAKAARKTKTKKTTSKSARLGLRAVVARVRRWILRGLLGSLAFVLALILLYSVVNPPITHTIWAEKRRLGDVDREWVPLEQMAPVLARSVVAAEDARFCEHWGFDVTAIRDALESGGKRGASTITQQVVKNVFLWQGRSWVRKALETFMTPVVEATWSKQRIVEVYLNVAEMGEGIFGAEAAARHYFGTGPDQLSPQQAALIAALLPNPKERSAADPGNFMRKRARQIVDGAATIERDGRAACFEH
ncbi:monofunctional biosynthetic peptidoglycan transglycosylase [Epibacterium sp. MM17-32]|uniref:monofunctional biosynthetic peptidoglycan transglycosylase n=1 Tax=Epibacterium sp. MM17-32 TaxID=2917734 RepID=UPI001EF5E1D1|nr:monofunctional biosynthetic peptidoglycan transglycosylase [Epibacterium sp. MM17-32]MCG7628242.1 monofunctional biosynthetic peptidoglycan transglycosylase [Epibacterium sp. MM17-32]